MNAARSVMTGALLLAAVATLPLGFDPLGRMIGHPDVDASNHAWGPWWWWSTLGRAQLPWTTTLLAAPEGGVLWFIDPFLAAVGAPFVGLIGAVGAYNLGIFLSVALTAFAGRSLAVAVGASPRAAWIGALACSFSPYVLCEIHNGVSEAANVGWATLTLAAGRRAIDGARTPGQARRWALTGVYLGLTAMGTWYYALSTGVTLGAWALLDGAALPRATQVRSWLATLSFRKAFEFLRQNTALSGALGAGALGGLLAAPVLALLRASITDPRSLVVRGDVDSGVREFLLAHNAVNPLAFLAPGGFQSVDLAANGEAFLHSSYLGLAALTLAVVGLRERRRDLWVMIGILPAAILSLGAYLWWDGAWVEPPWGGRIALPFAWLVKLLPDGGATHAQRLAWPAIAIVAALAARGADVLIARAPSRSHVTFGALAAVVSIDLLGSSPWPLVRAEALDTRAHERLVSLAAADRAASMQGARGVLDLPAEVGNTMATSRYLLYQTVSGLPIPYRPDARGGTASSLGLQAFDALFYPSAARPDQADALRKELTAQTRIDIGSLETKGGIRWVILHRELERGRGDVAVIQAQLEDWFGAPVELGPHLTWDVKNRRDDGASIDRVLEGTGLGR